MRKCTVIKHIIKKEEILISDIQCSAKIDKEEYHSDIHIIYRIIKCHNIRNIYIYSNA